MPEAQVNCLGPKISSHPEFELFCIHQMKQMNSCNGSCHDDSSINIVVSITITIIRIIIITKYSMKYKQYRYYRD